MTQPGPINVKALDISQSGMLLEVPQSAAHWALGKDLQLQFTLPAQSLTEIRKKLRRSMKSPVGG